MTASDVMPSGRRPLSNTVRWEILDTLVATVDTGGVIHGRSWGETVIFARANAFVDSTSVRVRAAPPPAGVVWRFGVQFGFRTGQSPMTLQAKTVFAQALLDTVNRIFNTPGTFDGRFDFFLDGVYEFADAASNQLVVDPGADYRVLFDSAETAFPTSYHAFSRTVLFAQNMFNGGVRLEDLFPVGRTAAHELGHGRRAMDIYAQSVPQPEFNPVNGATWIAPPSVMASSQDGWDAYSRHIINRNAGTLRPDAPNPLELPAEVEVAVRTASGPAPYAAIAVYAVEGYSFHVSPQPIRVAIADSAGTLRFPNPYRASGNLNALVVAGTGLQQRFGWMPFTDVALTHIRAPGTIHRLTITIGQ